MKIKDVNERERMATVLRAMREEGLDEYADRIESIWRRTLKSARQARWRAGKADAHPPEATTEATTETTTRAQEEKRNIPPTPPIKKKEEDLVGAGKANGNFAEPSLDEVTAFAATAGIPADTAEDFWLNCDGMGWLYRGSPIRSWRSMLKLWHRARKRKADEKAASLARMERRVDEREAKRQAHVDARMDERAAKKQAAFAARRRADNWIACDPEIARQSDEDFRKAVIRG